MDILTSEHIVDYVGTEIGPYFGTCCRQLADHPVVGEVRTTGMLAAFELVRDKNSRERLAADGHAGIFCRESAIRYGLMVRAVGDSIITAPPLICTTEEVDMLIERLVKALDATATEYDITV